MPHLAMRLADLIEAHRGEILEDWKKRAAVAAASVSLSEPALQDRIDHFIEELIASLREPPQKAPSEAATRAAVEHAGQRFDLGFHISAMVREYGLFADTVYDLLHRNEQHLPLEDLAAFAAFVQHAIVEAVTTFSSLKETQLRRVAAEHQGFLAHELRNSLATARLVSDELADREAAPALVAALQRSLGQLEQLLSHALVRSRFDAETPIYPVEIALQPALEECIDESTLDAERRNVSITLLVENVTPVCLDPRLFRSIMTNLIRNAVKFTRAGGKIIVRARLTEGERLVVEVEDQCGGLPEGAAARMFVPFAQSHDSRHAGHGLGLAIAKQAVQAQGGTIQVLDLPNRGCVFVVDLPRAVLGPEAPPC